MALSSSKEGFTFDGNSGAEFEEDSPSGGAIAWCTEGGVWKGSSREDALWVLRAGSGMGILAGVSNHPRLFWYIWTLA